MRGDEECMCNTPSFLSIRGKAHYQMVTTVSKIITGNAFVYI
jgi:hypothetical protein